MARTRSRDLPSLRTRRLLLRIPQAEDAGRMARFVSENRAHLAPWEPRRPPAHDRAAHWERFLPEVAWRAREGSGFFFILVPREEPRGDIQGYAHVSNVVRGVLQAAHLGYALDRRAVGQGFMEEALRAVIRFAFQELRLHRLMANYMPVNERSGRLLRRLGFVHEGYARDYLLLDGAWRDHVLTSLVNESWQPPAQTETHKGERPLARADGPGDNPKGRRTR